jgi:hypothetical protein
VYNVPPRRDVYRLLLDSGVDLVGSEDLQATQRILRSWRAPATGPDDAP